jgi:hypothetical protein
MTGPTQFTESNALLAVIEDDLDEARRIIATMLPGERRRLAEHAHKLADLLTEPDRIAEVLAGPCRWGYCSQMSDAYIITSGRRGDRLFGICQRHRADARANDYEIHERPAEVVL